MTDNQVETFRAALNEARASFGRSTQRVAEIEWEADKLKDELAKLRRTITALAALCTESPWADALGITDACLEVMEIETQEVTTQEVLRKLERLGFDLAAQKNAAASVHSILSRLAAKKTIEKVIDDAGSVTWKGPKYVSREDYAHSTEITDDDIPF